MTQPKSAFPGPAGPAFPSASAAPFAPSLVREEPNDRFLRQLLGEAGRFLASHPEYTSPRVFIDLWNMLRHRHRSLDLDDFGYDEAAARVFDPLLDFLYRVWWRVTLSGVENIPNSGRALLVINHSGTLPWDGAMVKRGIATEHPARRHCRMLALDMFTTLPYLQPLLRQLGEVRACPENGERLLARDELVGVFPEGVKGVGKYYRDRYRLARFGRGGFVRLALRTRSPIVPISVVGAEEIHPIIARLDFLGRPFGFPYFPVTPTFPALGPLGVVPLPSKWWIDVGKPIDLRLGPEVADRPMIVNELADNVRTTLQQMIDSRLSRRGSVFSGE